MAVAVIAIVANSHVMSSHCKFSTLEINYKPVLQGFGVQSSCNILTRLFLF